MVPKRLSHTRKWATERHGLVILLWFFSTPALVVPADSHRSWDFLQVRCFCKCNSIGRLGNGVSLAVRCLSGAGQPCSAPVLFLRGTAGVSSFGALGRKVLFLWSTLQGHGNSAVMSARSCYASKPRMVSISNDQNTLYEGDAPSKWRYWVPCKLRASGGFTSPACKILTFKPNRSWLRGQHCVMLSRKWWKMT